jgi:hypothetical protein
MRPERFHVTEKNWTLILGSALSASSRFDRIRQVSVGFAGESAKITAPILSPSASEEP